MSDKTTRPKPSRRRRANLKEFAERAREIRERLEAEGYRFSDSTEIVRRDRDSR